MNKLNWRRPLIPPGICGSLTIGIAMGAVNPGLGVALTVMPIARRMAGQGRAAVVAAVLDGVLVAIDLGADPTRACAERALIALAGAEANARGGGVKAGKITTPPAPRSRTGVPPTRKTARMPAAREGRRRILRRPAPGRPRSSRQAQP